MTTRINENYDHVKKIADELHEIATNECYTCNGEFITSIDLDNMVKSGEITEAEIEDLNTYGYTDNLESASMYDYFNDCYDIEYTIGSDMDYRGVRVMVACGGPNIYINTKRGTVELYWWTEHAEADLSKEAIEEIDAVFEELYTCR